MNRKINHHVSNHQVPPYSEAAVILFSPIGLAFHGSNLVTQLIRMSLDFGSHVHKDRPLVWCNSWQVTSEMLFPALQSVPRHFKGNTVASLHIIFISHGDSGCIFWNNNVRINTLEVLETLENLQFHQLDAVSFLGCYSLKNVRIPKLSFDIIGFSSYFY